MFMPNLFLRLQNDIRISKLEAMVCAHIYEIQQMQCGGENIMEYADISKFVENINHDFKTTITPKDVSYALKNLEHYGYITFNLWWMTLEVRIQK